jgi:purine-binding chemotaxis protein CheW
MALSDERPQLALMIRIRRQACAIPLSHVSEVLRPLPIEATPSQLDALLGVTILRGHPVPVIDASRLIGDGVSEPPGRFVALRVGQRTAVLAVNEVVGVRDLSDLTLESLPPLFREADSETVSRIGRLDQELLLVLRAARFVEDDLRIGTQVETPL